MDGCLFDVVVRSSRCSKLNYVDGKCVSKLTNRIECISFAKRI